MNQQTTEIRILGWVRHVALGVRLSDAKWDMGNTFAKIGSKRLGHHKDKMYWWANYTDGHHADHTVISWNKDNGKSNAIIQLPASGNSCQPGLGRYRAFVAMLAGIATELNTDFLGPY